MTFQKLIDMYGRDGDTETMEHLTHKVDQFVEVVREKHPDVVEHFLIKVDLLLNPHFTRESSKHAVSKFRNKDGTTGEHWNYETTTRVMESKGYDFNPCDWYYVLNMIYSDFYKSGRSDDTYIELAYDFMTDIDGSEDDAKKHYKYKHS